MFSALGPTQQHSVVLIYYRLPHHITASRHIKQYLRHRRRVRAGEMMRLQTKTGLGTSTHGKEEARATIVAA